MLRVRQESSQAGGILANETMKAPQRRKAKLEADGSSSAKIIAVSSGLTIGKNGKNGEVDAQESQWSALAQVPKARTLAG